MNFYYTCYPYSSPSHSKKYFNIINFNSCIIGLVDVLYLLYYLLFCHPSGDTGKWPFQHLLWPIEWITGLTAEKKARATLNCVFQYMLVITSTFIPIQLIPNKASSCLICFFKQLLFLGPGRNVRYFGSLAHFWLLRALKNEYIHTYICTYKNAPCVCVCVLYTVTTYTQHTLYIIYKYTL